MPEPPEQLKRLLVNVDRVAPEDELAERLAEGRPLRVKLGLDPTAPSVTLGWAVVLRKLRHFQELGHTAVLIVGDFTAQVGDPSLMAETRRRLTAEEVRGYAESVLGGFSRILLPDPLEIRWNSEWLASMDMEHILELSSATTVAQMLERADFAERMAEQRPISVLEFLYPLLQGYDSVAVEADVELGGSDQLWNLLMGRTVQQRYGMRPQVAMTMPLLLGTDGVNKMSQSLDNYVAVDDAPADMFGKVMSIPDDLMPQWYRLATELPAEESEAVISGVAEGSVHPAEAKRRLGREVVRLYWDDEEAVEAEAAFDRVFRDRKSPEEVPDHALREADPVHLPGVLLDAGLVTSTSEARRLIAQGAVKLDGARLTEEDVPRASLLGALIQVGKRRFVRFV
ncbi:MAG TPA: tyrosine--tRNA ligase [Acidimicrobiia bacterium]|nr:tyrosine--tRNA ligase [Acidimicrobiia bacterium]